MKKGIVASLGLASAVGALALREVWERNEDRRRFQDGRDYWRLIFPAESVRWADKHLTTYRIASGDIGIHLDVYPQSETNAPVVVIIHGMLTYGRLYLPLIRAFYEQGYTVIAPDLGGNGFSGGTRGDQTVGEATASVIETTLWARERFDGPLYLMGISLGGPLVYAAAAAGAPVAAISCVDLFTFDDRVALRKLIAKPWLADLLPFFRLLSIPFGWVRIPVQWLHRIEQAVAQDERKALHAWIFDPLVPRFTSLRALVSAAATPPAVSLENNKVPVLVLNQEQDMVLDPAVTRASYARLDGPKRYIELTGAAHWSFKPAFWQTLAHESIAWFSEHRVDVTVARYATAGRKR